MHHLNRDAIGSLLLATISTWLSRLMHVDWFQVVGLSISVGWFVLACLKFRREGKDKARCARCSAGKCS